MFTKYPWRAKQGKKKEQILQIYLVMATNEKIGVIGFGLFGAAVADLLAENTEVLLYSRDAGKVRKFNEDHLFKGFTLNSRIEATHDLQRVGEECHLIFPVVPSGSFRSMMRQLSPYLDPSKILIHGTKGVDVRNMDENQPVSDMIQQITIHPMSDVILQESSVLRVGCLSGPNLAREILDRQPTATVIASDYDEVIKLGQHYLSSPRFYVFGSQDLKGAELAGMLKNIFALASGILKGKGYGKNLQAMLLTRGLREMIALGKAMGSNNLAFLGTAGIGDLIATATSKLSRNYHFGYRFGSGESIDQILSDMDEVVEGLRTLKFAFILSQKYHVHVPITTMIYKVVYEGFEIDKALHFLMKYPGTTDVDFL
jgi:glycerol-3-phosphate dehydrogenase (NAD(P)+)